MATRPAPVWSSASGSGAPGYAGPVPGHPPLVVGQPNVEVAGLAEDPFSLQHRHDDNGFERPHNGLQLFPAEHLDLGIVEFFAVKDVDVERGTRLQLLQPHEVEA